MFDPVSIAVIAILGGIVAIQGALSVRSKRNLATATASLTDATVDAAFVKTRHNVSIRMLGKASAQLLTVTIKAAEKEMARRVASAVSTTLDEIVKLEAATGFSAAELTGKVKPTQPGARPTDALDDFLFGTPSPEFTRGEGFTMHGARDLSGLFKAGFKPDVIDGQPVLKRTTERSFMWSPGDPIPADAPAEVQELLRDIQAKSDRGESLDGERTHADANGSADPLADPAHREQPEHFSDLGRHDFGGRSPRAG